MEFDPLWLVLVAPLLFAAGWAAARWDFRQLRQERIESPRAYFVGLNLLLNEQHDEAIDAFVEAVQNDPDTAELHFALGNLFRRRGEFERAVRVHQHLLDRADVSADQRLRAQLALAQDFSSAGLFDRAESAYKMLLGSRFDQEASLALLSIHERTRDWPSALAAATHLESLNAGSFARRMAHYHCEMAAVHTVKAAQGDDAASAHVDTSLMQALQVCPEAPRPLVAKVEQALSSGDIAQALRSAQALSKVAPAHLSLVAGGLANCVSAHGTPSDRAALNELFASEAASQSGELALAVTALRAYESQERQAEALRIALSAVPDLRLARKWVADLELGLSDKASGSQQVLQAMDAALKPLDRYRCAACGFEATRYFWQCPGCHSWDSFPPRRLVEDVR